MRILILGATGYLGGNIARKLRGLGYEIICVVRNTSDTSHLKDLDVVFISNDSDAIEIALKHSRIDWIINSVCTYGENDTLYGDLLMSNISFPLSVLNLGVKYKVKNYITIGTSLPIYFNLYSFTKHKFGEFGKFLYQQEGINFADLELEMFYGGINEPDNRFINSCKKKLIMNESIALTEGKQKRDIIRVEDIIDIIARLIDLDFLDGYMCLPVGSGEQHSIVEILEYMKATLRSQSQLEFGKLPSRKSEPDTLADIRWYKDIDYHLKYSFFEGLKNECLR